MENKFSSQHKCDVLPSAVDPTSRPYQTNASIKRNHQRYFSSKRSKRNASDFPFGWCSCWQANKLIMNRKVNHRSRKWGRTKSFNQILSFFKLDLIERELERQMRWKAVVFICAFYPSQGFSSRSRVGKSVTIHLSTSLITSCTAALQSSFFCLQYTRRQRPLVTSVSAAEQKKQSYSCWVTFMGKFRTNRRWWWMSLIKFIM